MTDVEDVATKVAKIRESWNPAPKDTTLEKVVGIPLDPADTRATAHQPMAGLDHDRNPANDSVDAGRMFTDDGDEDEEDSEDNPSELRGKALDDALDKRNLPKSGSADEKRERVRAYDAGEFDGDDDDDEDDDEE